MSNKCICIHAPEQHGPSGCSVITPFDNPCGCKWDGQMISDECEHYWDDPRNCLPDEPIRCIKCMAVQPASIALSSKVFEAVQAWQAVYAEKPGVVLEHSYQNYRSKMLNLLADTTVLDVASLAPLLKVLSRMCDANEGVFGVCYETLNDLADAWEQLPEAAKAIGRVKM